MEIFQTIVNIKEIINCFNEGFTFISRFNEHYEKWTANKHNAKTPAVSINYDAINIRSCKVLPKSKSTDDNILVYMSRQLFNIESCRNRVMQSTNIRVEPFCDDKKLEEFSSVMLEHQKESMIVIRNEYKNSSLTLQLDMLNIVPGNDDICYRISYKAKCGLIENNYKDIATSLLENVVAEIIKTYRKYQQTVGISRERLELEARILNQMGYTDIIFKQVKMGYGIEIQSGRKKFIIGIPFNYPKEAPTVVQIDDHSYRQIEFESDWEPFLTIGHIVKAIA